MSRFSKGCVAIFRGLDVFVAVGYNAGSFAISIFCGPGVRESFVFRVIFWRTSEMLILSCVESQGPYRIGTLEGCEFVRLGRGEARE
jgi:hypothetical protein